jgi:hypothetical protein
MNKVYCSCPSVSRYRYDMGTFPAFYPYPNPSTLHPAAVGFVPFRFPSLVPLLLSPFHHFFYHLHTAWMIDLLSPVSLLYVSLFGIVE